MSIPLDPITGLPRPAAARISSTGVGTLVPGAVGSIRTLEPSHASYGLGYSADSLLGTRTTPIKIPTLTPAAAPAAAAASPTPAVTLQPPAPASSPDLQALIEADPLYHQTQADISAQRTADLATQTAQRQRALTTYGTIPDIAAAAGGLGLVGSDIGGDITDTTRQLANDNTAAGLSTTARLKQASDDVVKQVKDQLTARGLLSSGETGYQLNRSDLASRQASQDALQQLLDLLAGAHNSYLSNENARLAALASAASAAAGRIPATTASSGPDQYTWPGGSGDPTGVGAGGDYSPGDAGFLPPEYGPDAGYVPAGEQQLLDGLPIIRAQTYSPATGLISPGGGVYRSAGGQVTYQSNQGKYGRKPLL